MSESIGVLVQIPEQPKNLLQKNQIVCETYKVGHMLNKNVVSHVGVCKFVEANEILESSAGECILCADIHRTCGRLFLIQGFVW